MFLLQQASSCVDNSRVVTLKLKLKTSVSPYSRPELSVGSSAKPVPFAMAQSVESMYNQKNDPSGLVWVDHSGIDPVPDAVFAGKLANGQAVYVARAIETVGYNHNYDQNYLAVGKFVPGLGVAFPAEYHHNQLTRRRYVHPPAPFQVLTNPKQVQIKWALDEAPGIHPNAVKGGFTVNTIRYIGRTKYEGNHAVGYLHDYYNTPSSNGRLLVFTHNTRLVPFNFDYGANLTSAQYEILLAKPKPTCSCEMHYRLPLNCSNSCPKKK